MINNKCIVVSGGSKGLGEGIVNNLLNNGYNIATFSRTKSDFISKIELENNKSRFYWAPVDNSISSDIDNFVKDVVTKFGNIYGLINNAGVAADGIITLTDENKISQLIDVNLKGTISLTKSCVKQMLTQNEGIVINISSIIGIRGYAGLSIYSATKAAMDGLTRSLARELGPRNIKVNSIAPGYLKTDMTNNLSDAQVRQIVRRTPLGRLGTIEDIIGTIRFFLSPAAKFITGQTLVIDGGITC